MQDTLPIMVVKYRYQWMAELHILYLHQKVDILEQCIIMQDMVTHYSVKKDLFTVVTVVEYQVELEMIKINILPLHFRWQIMQEWIMSKLSSLQVCTVISGLGMENTGTLIH